MKKTVLPLSVFFACVVLFFFSSCDQHEIKGKPDAPGIGTIEISVDESFEPVISEEIAVYEATYPGSKIIAHYKSEADCLKDFFKDSANRLVIVTRGLTANEDRYMADSLKYVPGWSEVASDAIAIIVNSKSTDTLFTLQRLQQQLTGKIKRAQTIVFDGLNRTSTVRFIEDSVLKGQKFDTSIVRAVKSSSDVADYVASHENAIGFTGINRIGNPEDTAQVRMLKKVKLAYIRCEVCVNTPYVMPSQQSIMSRRYPLVRGLYYMIKENYKGLGSDFVSFLKYERGQLIFRRAYLAPIMDFEIRDVYLDQDSKK